MTAASRELPRSLGLADLVCAQILIVVGLGALGPGAKLGSLHWVYWLAGIALFHLPLAAVATHLNGRMPLEGGLYEWARAAFGDRAAFLVAWNFWMFVMVFASMLGLIVSAAVGYATGSSEAVMNDPLRQAAWSVVVTTAIVLLTITGLGSAKWVHNLASVSVLGICVFLTVLPLVSDAPRVTPAEVPFSLMQLVLFTRVAVYALAGYECMAVVAGECRDPSRTISRSIAIAVPIIAAIYILGTRSVLAFVPGERVDLVNPVAQIFSIALHPNAALAAIAVLTFRDVAQTSQVFAAATRMPLVAGWDGLLPAWFSALHPRWKTPVRSIAFAGGVMLVSSLGVIVLATRQEAFQILQSAAGVLFGSTYLVMFAIPLLRPAPASIRIAALSGFVVTLAFVALAFLPIVEVESALRYAAIVGAAVLLVMGFGVRRPQSPLSHARAEARAPR